MRMSIRDKFNRIFKWQWQSNSKVWDKDEKEEYTDYSEGINETINNALK